MIGLILRLLRDGCPYCGDPFPCLKHGKGALWTASSSAR